MRIILADDHDLVRDGMRRIVEQHPGLEVVAEASTQEELHAALSEHRADVVSLDISMPGRGFLDTLARIRAGHPRVGVLVVTMHAEEEWAVQALRAGASGYLSKRHSSEELVEALRRVHAGEVYISADFGRSLADRVVRGAGERQPHEALSGREFEVLCLIGEGLMVKTVASRLGISPRTVSTYRTRVLEKLALDSTADLIRYVVEHDLNSSSE